MCRIGLMSDIIPQMLDKLGRVRGKGLNKNEG